MNKKLALINLFENAKVMKSDIVYITNSSIILGSDSSYSIFKEINDDSVNNNLFELGLNELCYLTKEMILLMRIIKKDLNDNNNGIELIILDDKIIYGNIILYINNRFQLYQFKNKYQQFLLNIINDNMYSHIDNVKPILKEFLNCKSAEKTVVKVDKDHMMIMHGNLLPINKSDNISLDIYSISKNISLWVYHITKKTKVINVYIYCLNI